jgi:hypothetical protein
MAVQHKLFLHEELLLIALHDEKGTLPMGGPYGFGLAGAMLAELLSHGRIEIEATKKKLVICRNPNLLGDALLDESLTRIREAKRRTTLPGWVSRLSGTKRLHHRIAERLCMRGILRKEERRVLRIFRIDAYPTVDSRPERELVQRLREAIFRDAPQLDERTRLLLGVAGSAQLLSLVFDRKELKPRRKHIKALVAGDAAAKAVREAIEQAHAAHVATIG